MLATTHENSAKHIVWKSQEIKWSIIIIIIIVNVTTNTP